MAPMMRLNEDHPLHLHSYDKEPNDICFIYGDETDPVGVVLFTDKAKAWLKGFRRQIDSYRESERGITVSFDDMQKLSDAAEEDGLHTDARSTAGPDC